jgi:hypothetical protein
MANAIFYQNSRNIAAASNVVPDYNIIMNNENPVVLQNILDNLANYILNAWFWKLKVTYASVRGAQATQIYRYFHYDKFQGYAVDNLINGPNLDPSWFSKNGFNSVIDQLSVALAPGKIQNVFSTRPRGSYITLFWYA